MPQRVFGWILFEVLVALCLTTVILMGIWRIVPSLQQACHTVAAYADLLQRQGTVTHVLRDALLTTGDMRCLSGKIADVVQTEVVRSYSVTEARAVGLAHNAVSGTNLFSVQGCRDGRWVETLYFIG